MCFMNPPQKTLVVQHVCMKKVVICVEKDETQRKLPENRTSCILDSPIDKFAVKWYDSTCTTLISEHRPKARKTTKLKQQRNFPSPRFSFNIEKPSIIRFPFLNPSRISEATGKHCGHDQPQAEGHSYSHSPKSQRRYCKAPRLHRHCRPPAGTCNSAAGAEWPGPGKHWDLESLAG
jgi:hypothetical protein